MFPPTRSDPSPLAPRDTAPAKPCRVALGIPPIDFAAPLGVIDLNLIVTQGNFAFVPAGCSVTGPASTNVPLMVASASAFRFTAATTGLYILTVQYVSTPGSTAQLKENCGNPLILRRLGDSDGPRSTYTISVP
jgi:hypothetical protein